MLMIEIIMLMRIMFTATERVQSRSVLALSPRTFLVEEGLTREDEENPCRHLVSRPQGREVELADAHGQLEEFEHALV
jgi:hypothetical protein